MLNSTTVFDMSKIQFWKQFTTLITIKHSFRVLYSICQRYNFESNLQQQSIINNVKRTVFDMSKIQFWKQFTTIVIVIHRRSNCIRYVKDTILKAIYNSYPKHMERLLTVFDMSKIQFWKQFTTEALTNHEKELLYSICQRYNFESNLQLFITSVYKEINCIRYVKDTILKAIYN